MKKIRVTFYNEFHHERYNGGIQAIYPKGIHGCVADFLACDDIEVKLVDVEMPECGLTDEVLAETDVLMWWGHVKHEDVPDVVVDRVRYHVLERGMGFFPLHSAHHSKPFKAIVGASGNLLWGSDQKEIVWTVKPGHPIAAGVPEHFTLEEEMYGEPFMIPEPDELVFSSWFERGNIMRSGCVFYRGLGKVFYFQPGHERCRSFYDPNVQQVIKNAVRWLAPTNELPQEAGKCRHFTEEIV